MDFRRLQFFRGGVLLAVPCALLIGASVPAKAQGVFDILLTLPDTGESGSSSFSTVEDLFNEFENDFAATLASYTDTSAATAAVNFRGVDFSASFPIEEAALTVRVPACGVDETFDGADRDASVDLFEDFLEANSGSLLTCLVQNAVANTGIDPVAGNPNSLMGRMAVADFDLGFDPGSDTIGTGGTDGSTPNLAQLGFQFGSFSTGDYDGQQYSIPLRYTFNLDGGYAVAIDAPVEILTVEGANAYGGSFGVGVRIPMTDDWVVTPTARIGGTGSIDLGAGAVLYSFGASSLYRFDVDGVAVDVGNMFGFYQTVGISAGDFQLDYDLTNYMSRQGVRVTGEMPFEFFGAAPTGQLSIIRTDFFGDDLFVDGYTEIAPSIRLSGEVGGVPLNLVNLGFTYTVGDSDFQEFRFGGSFRF